MGELYHHKEAVISLPPLPKKPSSAFFGFRVNAEQTGNIWLTTAHRYPVIRNASVRSDMEKIRIMSKVTITQVRSAIGKPKRQKDTIQALGIKKLNVPVVKEVTPQIIGMIRKVSHLLKVQES